MQLQWISFGCLSLFGLGYYFKKLSEQQKEYRRKLLQFQATYKESYKNKDKTLSEIMRARDNSQQAKAINFCLINLKPKYNPDTFKLFQRERSVFARSPKYWAKDIIEHQMGGDFTATRDGREEILCKLNDFHLSAYLLKEEKKDVNLFREINKLQPIVQSVTTYLFPLLNVAIYGKLYYDSSKLSWAIQPFFLTGAFQLPTVVQRFYTDKVESNNMIKFAIFLGGVVLAYFTILSPLQSLYAKRNLQQKQKAIAIGHQSDIDYFRNRDCIIVKGESLLNCEKCKTKNVEIIYQCGHLAICLQCHQKNQSKECPLCKKVSKKFMKIFMA